LRALLKLRLHEKDLMKHLRLTLIAIYFLAFLPVGIAGEGGIGIKLGTNFSKSGFIGENTKFQPGFTAGLTYEKKAAKVFAFEIGLLYHWKRTSTEAFALDSITFENFKTGFHIVELTPVFKFYTFDWMNLNFGPYVSYIIAVKGAGIDEFGVKKIWNLISDSEFRDENGDQFLYRLDFGFHVGAEFITNSGFGFGARYAQGFGDVTNKNFEWNISMVRPDSEKVKTSSIIGYIFYQF
jgi:hypothetical protein